MPAESCPATRRACCLIIRRTTCTGTLPRNMRDELHETHHGSLEAMISNHEFFRQLFLANRSATLGTPTAQSTTPTYC